MVIDIKSSLFSYENMRDLFIAGDKITQDPFAVSSDCSRNPS